MGSLQCGHTLRSHGVIAFGRSKVKRQLESGIPAVQIWSNQEFLSPLLLSNKSISSDTSFKRPSKRTASAYPSFSSCTILSSSSSSTTSLKSSMRLDGGQVQSGVLRHFSEKQFSKKYFQVSIFHQHFSEKYFFENYFSEKWRRKFRAPLFGKVTFEKCFPIFFCCFLKTFLTLFKKALSLLGLYIFGVINRLK